MSLPPRQEPRLSELPARESRYLQPDLETLDRARLEAFQEARLLELVPYAYERSPLTRHHWLEHGVHPRDVRSLEDFRERVPFVDKEALRDFGGRNRDPFGGLLCLRPSDLQMIGTTSGTTGHPTPTPRPHDSVQDLQCSRDLWEAGLRPGDRGIWVMFTFRSGHCTRRYDQIGAVPIFANHGVQDALFLLEAASEFQPKSIYVMNNILIQALDQTAQEHGIDPTEALGSIETAIVGGEPLSPRAGKLLADWGIVPMMTTSLGDVCGATECREQAGIHAWEDLVLVESLDPGGHDPVRDGERGELVTTSLQDDAAPLVRFRTGDVCNLTTSVCACGRTHARFDLLGRKSDQVVVHGLTILPQDVWGPVERVRESSSGLFQLILAADGGEAEVLRLRVGYDEGGRAPDAVVEELKANVFETVGVEPEIDLVPNVELLKLGPPHKIPRTSREGSGGTC